MSRLSFSALQDPTGKLFKKWSFELSFLISLPKHGVPMLLDCSLKVQSKGVLQTCWVCEDHNSGKGLTVCWNIRSYSFSMSGLWIIWLGIFLYRYCCSLFTKHLKCCNHLMTVDFRLHCANALWATEWWKRDWNPVQNFNYGATVPLFILPSIRGLSKKLLSSVKCIQSTPHTTSNYIKTEEECVAISFQIHRVIFLGGEQVLLRQQLNIDVPNAAALLG